MISFCNDFYSFPWSVFPPFNFFSDPGHEKITFHFMFWYWNISLMFTDAYMYKWYLDFWVNYVFAIIFCDLVLNVLLGSPLHEKHSK